MVLLLLTRGFFCFLIAFCLCFLVLFFLSFYSKNSVTLVWVGFVSLVLGFLGQKSLTVVPWVCTFEAILLEKQWLLGQQISKSQTMILDFRPILASLLTVFYIIFSKFTNFWSCFFILILIDGLKLS